MNIEAEISAMQAMLAGQTALLAGLIRAHPDEAHLQMSIVESIELLLNGAAGQTLTEEQREKARDFAETIRSLRPRKVSTLPGTGL
jgi:hypothetical protein